MKVGGKLVYSTCSLNPIEDEAVISSAILETNESIDIVNVNDIFPDLKRSPGLIEWKIFNEKMIVDSPDDSRFFKSMFPVPQCQNLQHCMRFFPHQNDSGGFFVAVLEKKKEFDLTFPQKTFSKWKEPPIKSLSQYSSDICEDIISSFGFPQTFPRESLFVHTEKIVKNIFYLSKNAINLVQSAESEQLRAFSVGVRLFSWKQFNDPLIVKAFPCFEGISIIFHFATKRKIQISINDCLQILEKETEIEKLSNETQQKLSDITGGGLIVYIDNLFIYPVAKMKNLIISQIKKENLIQEQERLRCYFSIRK